MWGLYIPLVFVAPIVYGFNLDWENPKFFNSPDKSSFFGHRVCGVGYEHRKSKILVTDPHYSNGTGSVYSCIYSNGHCKRLPVQVELNAAFGLSLACSNLRAMVCGPRMQQNCQGFNYLNGVCVEISDSLVSTYTYKPVFQECHVIPPLDVVILFDDSKSIISSDFKIMINFIKAIINNINDPRAHVAVATFSTKVSAIFNFENFEADRNAEKLMAGVKQSEGHTHTPTAILYVLSHMFQSAVGMRENSQKLLVVITDGKSNDKVNSFSSVLAKADERKIKRIAIGVGKDYSSDELLLIARDPRFVLETPSFNSLSSILSQLTEKIFSIEGTNVAHSSSIQNELSQGGFSIALSEEVSVFGAVGTYSWSGGLDEKIPNMNSSFINASNVEEMEDSYLGYSVVVAMRAGKAVYFTGAPRHKHKGSVFGFTQESNTKQWNITHTVHGPQLGSYFGAELCVLKGDGVQFLAIGAPMFYAARVGGEVHICTFKNALLNCSIILRGQVGNAGGRFGSALAALKDMNGDSIMELVVGAPQEELGKGTVYIFTSYLDGYRTKYTQRVRGATLNSQLKYFGLSLDSVNDLSSDGLSDLLVGSRGTVTVLRTHPVMCVLESITLDPPVIPQNIFHCSAPHGLNTPIAKATVCVQLKEVLKGTISDPLNAAVSLNMELDSGSDHPRLMFSSTSSSSQWNTTISTNTTCKNVYISIPSCISDYHDVALSVKITVRGEMLQRPNLGLKPVLSPDCSSNQKHWVLLEKVCGDDHICVSDLSLYLSINMDMVVKIEGYLVNISVEVVNKKEDASDTELVVSHPSVLSFTHSTLMEPGGYVICTSNKTGNLTFTTCKLQFTIRQKTKVLLNILFQVSDPSPLRDQITITALVKSQNENFETLQDNTVNVSVPVKQLTNILLLNDDSTSYTSYNHTATILHRYKVTNDGNTSLPVSVVFVLPVKMSSGLLWNVSLPKVNDAGVLCKKPVIVKNDSADLYSQRCSGSSCNKIICSINMLNKNQAVTFAFTGKLSMDAETFSIQVESWGSVKFDQDSYTQYLNEEDLQHSIGTLVESPLADWTVLITSLSVLFGLLVMTVVFIILYKVGFLKSKVPPYSSQQDGVAPSQEQNELTVTDGETAASTTGNYQALE